MHIVFLELGPEIAKEFYGDIQKLVNNWLLVEGHSIGIGDCIADHETYQEIQATIKKSKVDLWNIVPNFFLLNVNKQSCRFRFLRRV